MYKLILVLSASLMLYTASAQDSSSTKSSNSHHIVTLNLVSAIINQFGFNYEFFQKNHSFGVHFATSLGNENNNRKVLEVFPTYTYYFRADNEPDGWFVAPHLRYRSFEEIDQYQTQSYGAGVFFGYQYRIVNKLVLRAYVGPDYAVGNIDFEPGFSDRRQAISQSYTNIDDYGVLISPKPYQGVLINGGFTVGIIF